MVVTGWRRRGRHWRKGGERQREEVQSGCGRVEGDDAGAAS